MRWEELTSVDFKKAVNKSKRVCILALGVIEKHGNHLPLGTDMYNVHFLACRAAEKEHAVVFPPYYFTQIFTARHQPGTISIKPRLMFDLFENVCDEIGRNGFKKIILLNGHGGNQHLIPYFTRTMLYQKKDYVVYYPEPGGDIEYEELQKTLIETKDDGHGGESETSRLLAVRPELVKMGQIAKSWLPLRRLRHLTYLCTPVNWYADYPDHYAGNAKLASRQKGKKLLKARIKYLAKVIKAVKDDTSTKKLYDEFFSRIDHSSKK